MAAPIKSQKFGKQAKNDFVDTTENVSSGFDLLVNHGARPNEVLSSLDQRDPIS
jgi:hypothetical protein